MGAQPKEYGISYMLNRLPPGCPVPGWVNDEKEASKFVSKCPTCGGDNCIIKFNEVVFYGECQDCGTKGPPRYRHHQALYAWNFRQEGGDCPFCGGDKFLYRITVQGDFVHCLRCNGTGEVLKW